MIEITKKAGISFKVPLTLKKEFQNRCIYVEGRAMNDILNSFVARFVKFGFNADEKDEHIKKLNNEIQSLKEANAKLTSLKELLNINSPKNWRTIKKCLEYITARMDIAPISDMFSFEEKAFLRTIKPLPSFII
ncbi:MAG: hypothetical protein ACTSQI_07810 [Candidatus Helarchaeota archaeon]